MPAGIYRPTEPNPPAFAARVARACASIDAVTKDQRNTYQNYNYASADSVYAAVRMCLAAESIILTVDEDHSSLEELERKDKTILIYCSTFSFRLCTPEGVGHIERVRMIVPWTGPQSMQAARTYATKYWLRSKFLIPTGEPDLDALPNVDIDPISTAVSIILEDDDEQ